MSRSEFVPVVSSTAVRPGRGGGRRCVRRLDLPRDRRGTTAVEFALVAPVFIALVLTTICLGLYLTYAHAVQELTASAARASVAGLTSTERDTLARAYVASAVGTNTLLNQNDVTVTTSQSGPPATSYVVTVSYTLTDTPIPSLAKIVKLSVGTISATSMISFGGF